MVLSRYVLVHTSRKTNVPFLTLPFPSQFYCQATGCVSSNSTTPVQPSSGWGTDLWSCSSFACFCPEGTKVCSNQNFPLGNIINTIGGTLDLPCDYVDPSDPLAETECILSAAQLNQFVGPSGLALNRCKYGQCLSQFDREQDWQRSALQARAGTGEHLSGGVTAGLVILGAASFLLLFTCALGYWLQRKAARKPCMNDLRAIGISWDDIHLHAEPSVIPRWASKEWRKPQTPVHTHTSGRSEAKVMPSTPLPAVFDAAGVRLQDQRELTAQGETKSGGLLDQQASRHILRGVSSAALPGTLNYIIGPSGAGKSSLVDILAGRAKRGRVRGSMAWLGVPQPIKSNGRGLESRVALVDQDDSTCLPGYLTVREALAFAAELSLPENVHRVERRDAVDAALKTLGLEEVADNRIGDSSARGISGGERRRVSLGVALVGRPKILIADECTSGLDAFSAHRVMTALRSLACGTQGGTTVIATLHQPSSQIFDLADHIILLGDGQVLFDGPPTSALAFCQETGVPVPVGHNVADHLLTFAFECSINRPLPCVSLGIEYNSNKSTSGRSLVNLDGERNLTHVRFGGRLDGEVDDTIQHAPEGGSTCIEMVTKGLASTPLALDYGGSYPATTFMTQVHALVKRAILMTRREMLGVAAHVIGSAVVAIFVGACFFQVKLDLGGFQNRVGSMFFIFILLLFSSLSAIVGLAKVRLLMMRERASGLYSPFSWIAAHLLFDLIALRAIPSVLIVTIVYWMVGLHSKASYFFQFMLITVIFSWVLAVYNMLLAALIEELATAILLGALFVLFNLAFAGFIMSLSSLPRAVRWLRWLVPAKYALEAVASNELKGLQFIDTFAGVPVKTDVSLFANKLFGFRDDAYYRNLIILACGFLVGFSLMLVAAVWRRMHELR